MAISCGKTAPASGVGETSWAGPAQHVLQLCSDVFHLRQIVVLTSSATTGVDPRSGIRRYGALSTIHNHPRLFLAFPAQVN